jgi:hypothetical protein
LWGCLKEKVNATEMRNRKVLVCCNRTAADDIRRHELSMAPLRGVPKYRSGIANIFKELNKMLSPSWYTFI